MAKAYHNSWSVKKLLVNFNQKQWRQDFGEYVRRHLFWGGTTRVSRSRNKGNSKQFEVYDGYGGEVVVQYQKDNKIVNTTHQELLSKYLEERSVN